MKKQILNLGNALDKAEQIKINGGGSDDKCKFYTGNGSFIYGIIDECGDCVDPKHPYFTSC